jgi:hypothetical protein
MPGLGTDPSTTWMIRLRLAVAISTSGVIENMNARSISWEIDDEEAVPVLAVLSSAYTCG